MALKQDQIIKELQPLQAINLNQVVKMYTCATQSVPEPTDQTPTQNISVDPIEINEHDDDETEPEAANIN